MERSGGRRDDVDANGVRDRIRYRFDNLLARGPSATLIWLGAVTAAAVLVSSLVLAVAGVTFAGSEDENWLEDLWQSLLRMMDPGTMASDVGWGRRLLALLVTVFGLLVAGTLIGIIAAGVEDRIERMRLGRSVVIESDHLVVLGESRRLPMLLRQLALAGTETVVVLADRDPAELQTAVRASQGERAEWGTCRVVYRSGDPTVPADLALTRLTAARAVVVLSDQHSDVAALETVLAVASELGGLDEIVLVVELLEQANAELLGRAYGESIHPLVTSEAVTRTAAFALRRRGLSQVVAELLDFRGCDLYVVASPDVPALTFGDLVAGYTNARPVGVVRADGSIELCPPFDTAVGSDVEVVVIAGDHRAIEFAGTAGGDAPEPTNLLPPEAGPPRESLVIVGWNELGMRLVSGWWASSAASSRVCVIIDPRQVDPESVSLPDVGPVSLEVIPTDDAIGHAAGLSPTTVVLLAPPIDDDDAADVRTMLGLETLRRQMGANAAGLPRLVIELRDAAHVALIAGLDPDDVVISDEMGSHFLAQLVDEPRRRAVLLALYAADEASIQVVPCDQLDLVGARTGRDIVARAAGFGLVAIGWRSARRGGVVRLDPDLNDPRPADTVELAPGDDLVVIGRSTPFG